MHFVTSCDEPQYLYHQILQKVMAAWHSKNKSISLKSPMAQLWKFIANCN